MKTLTGALGMVIVSMLTGCTPRIEVAAPKEPITINMNVKIEHEIHIKVDKDVETLLKSRSDLFWGCHEKTTRNRPSGVGNERSGAGDNAE